MPKWDIKIGTILRLKKPHPCGCHEWEVLRVGADIGIKCKGCGRYTLVARPKLEKGIKAIVMVEGT